MRRWTAAILALAVAGTMELLFVAFGSGGLLNSRVGAAVPTATLTIVQLGNAMAATQQAEWQEHQLTPKPTLPPNNVTGPTSCPVGPIQTAIAPGSGDSPIHYGNITTSATIAPSQNHPFVYTLYAGSSSTTSQQGFIIVFVHDQDPCRQGGQGESGPTYSNTPYQRGAMTLTQISGDNVLFSLADGGTGSFDYITGKYN